MANGRMIDFRLIARRGAKAAKGILNRAIENVGVVRPVTIYADKAQAYARAILETNRRYDPHFDRIRHIDRKWPNKRIESDHAAMKRSLGQRQRCRSLRTAKATLSGIETDRTIEHGRIDHKQQVVVGEVHFVSQLCATT
ncbi:MAG: DDE-type integrase/transposase/recombinase [Pseudomonadota bacterium]